MIKVAITGNIASGKSEVQKILVDLGYKFLDTDDVAHKLLSKYSTEILNLFSNIDISDNSGNISREKLGKIVFTNNKHKEKLESFIHPKIRSEILKFFTDNINKDFVFVGIPLLFEANMQDLFDKKVLIYANDTIRLDRLIKRNSYNLEYAQKRLNSQNSQDLKKNLCDYIIENNSDKTLLNEKVIDFLNDIKRSVSR